mgnify:CR=1 FL=1
MEMIQTEKLVYEYEKRDEEGNVIGTSRAIDEVDIEAKEGQFIAILGHNGSGKSTLAKHLNAILMPTEGSVWVNGKNTSNPDELWNVRQSAGMVFQNPDNQIIGTVVEEDVGFGPENLGVPTDEIWQRVEESLKAVGMIEYRHHSPNKLSGGQKQRVAIAGVVAMEPKCIVMDEPTAMLDPVGRREVLKTVHKLRKQKKVTVILITHYMEEVEILCDRIIILDRGKIIAQGTSDELKALAKIEEKVTIETKHFKPEFLEKLQAAPNVDKAEYAGHQLVITYKSGKNNVAKLIEELSAAGITCNKIFSERPTLNDVFLELTGKELRD